MSKAAVALTKRVDYPLGNALNPVTDKQLEGKFNALVEPALGESGATRIVDLAWKLDSAANVSELMRACVDLFHEYERECGEEIRPRRQK